MKRSFVLIAVFIALCCVVFIGSDRRRTTAREQAPPATRDPAKDNSSIDTLIAMAREKGSARIIVGLSAPFAPEGGLEKIAQQRQRREIKRSQEDFLARYRSGSIKNIQQFDYIPYLGCEAGIADLERMKTDQAITGVYEDMVSEGALAESTPIVGANTAWASGYTGAGQTVAILDSGVEKTHSFLAGRVVSEACYSSNIAGSSVSVCPGAVTESTATDSGVNCPVSVDGCAHGTNVAGIAAGSGATFSGVAKGANIIAIQMFSRFDSAASCGSSPAPCARYWTSDLIKGLERVKTLSLTMNNIAAVNLSLQTGQQFTGNCDASHAPTKAAIDNLRSAGIVTVVCAGNFAFTNALTAPACISTAVSVGSTDDGSLGTGLDTVSSFSDSSPLLHILAPGRWINSSIPGNVFQNYSGTSMATPHVVGAYALLRQRKPNASIDKMTTALIATGTPITDSRNGLVKPRLRVDRALQAIVNTPFDYDGDDKADVSVYRPSVGDWYVLNSGSGFSGLHWGTTGDRPTPADYDGDGKTDIAVYRPSNGGWYWLNSSNNSFSAANFGVSEDLPTPADYDGDGKADISVFRPSVADWYRLNSGSGNSFTGLHFGSVGDKPAVGDFDGDGKADISVYRPSTGSWFRLNSSTGAFFAINFGVAEDKPTPADYDGDGTTDIGVYRPSVGDWFRLNSSTGGFVGLHFGAAGDRPAPADFDGDGKADIGVFRPSDGNWYLLGSTAGFSAVHFGISEDAPTPSVYIY